MISAAAPSTYKWVHIIAIRVCSVYLFESNFSIHSEIAYSECLTDCNVSNFKVTYNRTLSLRAYKGKIQGRRAVTHC